MTDLTIAAPAAPEPTDDELTDQPADTDPEGTGQEPVKVPRERRVNAWRDRRKAARAARRGPRPRTADRSRWAIAGVVALALLVLVIVVVGLSVSLGPLRDTALAVHIDPTAASLWWIGVDGLVVVAIIAAVVLRHDPWARWYALGVVAFFTAASGLLQFLHGLGLTAPDQAAGGDPTLPKAVVALVAALVIGTIFCATHLLVYVLRHLFPNAMGDQPKHPAAGGEKTSEEAPEQRSTDSDTEDGSADNDRPEPPALDPETDREVRKWFAACAVHLILDAGGKPTRAGIARSFGIADRQAGYVIADVVADREEAAERAAAHARDESGRELIASMNGSG
ncbi:hypothetical protein ACBJ59_12060 [Nonomuraea sp. MTCD27]|uniref:hypothetical protein n=1 Tax=Nonomuraea sp. MTCD27 TaxID=1676747 RepID=UPI0035C11027